MLQIRFLGQFDVRADGKRTLISTRAAQSLFAFLVLTAGTPHRRENIARLLWPDMPAENARRNLRQELWRLRKVLGAQPSGDAPARADEYLLAEELSIAFNPNAQYWLDTAQLEQPVSADETLNDLTSQLALYKGELLPGFYDDWVMLERDRVDQIFQGKMQQLIELLLTHERWTAVLEWSERWIAFGHSPEPAYRALMLAHSALGNASQVAVEYERCVQALRGELGVEPSEETRTVHEKIARGERVTSVSLAGTRMVTHIHTHNEPPAPGEPPFKGLEFFDQADANLFFGREQLVTKLAEALRAQRFLAVVVGASGSGKSSTVRAGLIPALQGSGDGSRGIEDRWRVVVMTPTAHPLEALAVALTSDSESVTATATLLDDLARDPRALQLYLRRYMANREPLIANRHTLLVVDQFEELFTLCREEFEREQFIDNLLDAIVVSPDDGATRTQLLTLVLTIRADFYAHLAQYPDLRDAVAAHQEYIGPMNVEELRRAIEEPAKLGGWEFEPGLVDLILRDVGTEPGALPLLSHALLETWKRRSGHTMTLKGYADAGGVRGAIALTAETTYQLLSPQEQIIARSIFVRLTELGEGTEDTRRRADYRELEIDAAEPEQVRAVLTRLADARLITTNADTVEVAHEALIREWPRLREWLNDDREGLQLHRHLTEAANEWALMERDASALYRGARLASAVEFANANANVLNVQERAFLEASQTQAQREAHEREEQQQRELQAVQKLAETEQRANKQLRRRAIFLAGAFALAILLAAIAFVLLGVAQNSSAIAQASSTQAQSLALASAAQVAASRENPELGLAYALAANKLNPPAIEAQAPLADLAYMPGLQHVFTGHTSAVTNVEFSPDGKTMLSSGNSGDNTLILWDVASGRMIRRFGGTNSTVGHTDGIWSLAISPDGKMALSGSADTTMILWDVATGQALRQFKGHAKAPYFIAWSSDEKTALSVSDDESWILWDIATGEVLHRVEGQTDLFVTDLSPDGKTILGGYKDGKVALLDVASGQVIRTFAGPGATRAHSDVMRWVEFSPDGKMALSSSGDKTIALWDVATGQLIRRLTGHKDVVGMVRFSPDGKTVISGGGSPPSFSEVLDKSIIWWDLSTGQILRRFDGPQPNITSLAFSPDGKKFVSGSGDKTIVLWGLDSGAELHRLTEHTSAVNAVAFSPDGKLGVSGAADGSIIFRNTATGELIHRIAGESIVNALAYSPDGKNILAGTMDGALTLFDVSSPLNTSSDTGQVIRRLVGHTAPVESVAFSPDGKTALSGSIDRSLILWDISSGQILRRLEGHTNTVNSVTISPAGKRVLSGGYDHAVILWDLESGQILKQFPQPSVVNAVAFRPDGKSALFGLADGNVIHFDLDRGAEVLHFVGHDGAVKSVAFSPDGKFAMSGGLDKQIIVWDVASGQAIRHFTGHDDTVNAVAFSPDGKTALSGSVDKTVRVWRMDSLDDLLAWTQTHRIVSDVPCDQRVLYNLTPLCDASNATPTP